MELSEPKSPVEAIRYYSDPAVTLQTMTWLRWPDGVRCPTCGRDNPRFIRTRSVWECRIKHPKQRFSAKTGTVMEDSPLGLDKWFVAAWLLANCKNGVSSLELHRDLGITQKSAWFMLQRLRLAMKKGTILKVDESDGGNTEPPPANDNPDPVDEYKADKSFVGGLAKNMHKKERKKKIKGRGTVGKEIVMGVLVRGTPERPSQMVKARVVPNTTMEVLQAEVREAVKRGSRLYTDALRSYNGLAEDYLHEVVDHAIEYVRDRVHTNGMENFRSLLKRTLKGTYINVSPMHLDRYVDEQAFRVNEREKVDAERFRLVLSSVVDKRLTYAELTGHVAAKGTTPA